MSLLPTFANKAWNGLSSLFLLQLDRNFASLSRELQAVQKTADYTLTSEDIISSVQVDATAAAATVYLPVQPVGSRRRTVIKIDSSVNAVTISGNGALINGAATQSLAAQYDSITVEPTGTGWLIVAST